MKWTKILPDGKGGYNVFDNWTHGDEMMRKVVPIILFLPIILTFSLFLPAVLWFIIPLNYTKENHENTYLGLGVSLLFFLDYWLGGPLWSVFHITEHLSAFYFFGALHIMFSIINIIRLFAYHNGVEIPNIFLYIALVVTMYLGYDKLSNAAEKMSSSTPCSWLADWHNKEVQDRDDNPWKDYE